MLLSLFNLKDPLIMLATIVAFLSALFICMPAHEFAHAHAAYKEGDLTAKAYKRYTLAPFAHIDFMGLVMLLFFNIGFAKPVPVDSRNFKRGKKSAVRVAVAGVFVNLLIGIVSAFIYCLLIKFWPQLFSEYGFISKLYQYFFEFMISLNFMFAFFNILPIYPLDGFRLVETFARPGNRFVEFMKRYSFFILIFLLITDVLGMYINFFAGGTIDLIFKGFSAFFNLF